MLKITDVPIQSRVKDLRRAGKQSGQEILNSKSREAPAPVDKI